VSLPGDIAANTGAVSTVKDFLENMATGAKKQSLAASLKSTSPEGIDQRTCRHNTH
jgi:hypothetical protein